ncbi:hypothetical protein ANO14919_058620 [Xylariales sp. No.14919]|nr:hypothetical protein ANO14919_058620 [Xylariales sp. No.14919]
MAFKANRTVACAVSWSLTSGVLDSRMPRGIRRLDAKTRSVVWSLRPSGACAENGMHSTSCFMFHAIGHSRNGNTHRLLMA